MDFDISRLPDDFSRALFHGSIRVLGDKENAVRLHLFAGGFRELFTHILHSFAPDDDVRACSWFEQARDTPTVTRKQRATYATQGGLSDKFIKGLGVDNDALHKAALSAMEQLNKATHVKPGSIITDEAEISAFVAAAVTALDGLITSFSTCKDAVSDALRDDVYNEMMQSFFHRTFDDIDILAGKGYEVGSFIDDEEITVEAIGAREIRVKFSGVAPVTLHYGKGEDAAAVQHDFPFWMTFRAPVADPTALEYSGSYFDDSSWYE